ncbi:hypothetical protein [Pseudotamlana carrageenivorans]|uniref:Outer membrane protein beta-barrel domain-containing protein n=1 Tax=Pseudotamlana carrageenivorans TaxID=2069432 RepID=A0A2I7SH20_9FLAO|nr:hypothetical protein [Tamlana carrageenivorans]AUS05144.1 hypothetical protein C1A40_06525 [Tamlana carrageenivorans]
MKYKSFLLLVFCISLFVTKSFSQKGYYKISNGIGISGGLTQFNIITDNFSTQASKGFTGGLRVSVDMPPKRYNLSYGMQFSENVIEILGRPSLLSSETEQIRYKLLMAQLDFALHVKLFKNPLCIMI